MVKHCVSLDLQAAFVRGKKLFARIDLADYAARDKRRRNMFSADGALRLAAPTVPLDEES
ncbi:hypothetical protein AAJCM20276_37840 (plasmid) [Acetobacter aceti]|uniref:Uncharacterized protein n=1 Tax=Acetobacter aceti TaxID=435 RepID=A0A6S6PQ14_ACEAC|nr:hypothetical protein AAJCM20276_37840 [Acetobacter aceti]